MSTRKWRTILDIVFVMGYDSSRARCLDWTVLGLPILPSPGIFRGIQKYIQLGTQQEEDDYWECHSPCKYPLCTLKKEFVSLLEVHFSVVIAVMQLERVLPTRMFGMENKFMVWLWDNISKPRF